MSNARGKSIDTTYLSLDLAEERGLVHRDYIAHCFRWSHVIKLLLKKQSYKTARILDVGCGKEIPFGKSLYSNRLIPEQYIGVDYGPVYQEDLDIVQTGKMLERAQIYERTDFMELAQKFDPGHFTHIISFEVLEHVEPTHMRNMLKEMQRLLNPDGSIIISTPCWDRKSCAANHVNEMRYQALGAVFQDLGMGVREVYGTFASISDYADKLDPDVKKLFDDLREYYDSNVLSTILAPLIPSMSRNALWVVDKYYDKHMHIDFSDAGEVPWGSSEHWNEMLPQHNEASI